MVQQRPFCGMVRMCVCGQHCLAPNKYTIGEKRWDEYVHAQCTPDVVDLGLAADVKVR